MRTYDVQAIDLATDVESAFRFVADAEQLPRWTDAFVSVRRGRAIMRTPAGEAEVALEVVADRGSATVDWIMRFADGSVATAYSRLVELDPGRTLFSFVLTPPPVPLEALEGTLRQQSRILSEEMKTLKGILEARANAGGDERR